MIHLAPLLCIGRVVNQSLLLLVYGLLQLIPVISLIFTVPAVSVIGCVDLLIILLLLRGTLAT
jgi:hypothetical protein